MLPPTFDSTGMGSLWLHAVSVGEVLSAVELIKRVKTARPDVDIFVSTATLAGRATAEQRLGGLVRGFFMLRWITSAWCGGCCGRYGRRRSW